MDYLLAVFRSLLEPRFSGGTVFILFAAVAMFGFSVALYLTVMVLFDPIRRRLSRVAGGRTRLESQTDEAIEWLRRVTSGTRLHASSTRQRLMLAGYRSQSAEQAYNSIRIIALIGLPLVAAGLASMIPKVTAPGVVLVMVLAAGLGYIGPSFYLDRKVRHRQTEIRNSFPDALDMLVVCTEAGLGLDSALQRVGNELAISHPTIAGEIRLVNAEIRAGVRRQDAYRNLAVRTGVDDIKSLIATLTQSLQFGTNIADVLRIYAEDLRDKRLQRAEELAAMLSVKLIFPLALCFLPAFFIIAIGPAAISLLDAFSSMASAGVTP